MQRSLRLVRQWNLSVGQGECCLVSRAEMSLWQEGIMAAVLDGGSRIGDLSVAYTWQ
jgi:hypothetical protein